MAHSKRPGEIAAELSKEGLTTAQGKAFTAARVSALLREWKRKEDDATRSEDRYVQRMADLMSQRGLCGLYDGEELAVKKTNTFNDQYDIFTADGFIRRQAGSYRSTCYPAWF